MSELSLTLDTTHLAHHYEQASSGRQFKVGKVLIEKLALRLGERALDVGTGTGLLAEHVAAIVGPSGSVEAIDPLPLRIDLANRRSRPNLVFRVGNAYDLEGYAEASFDVVYLNAVFHWLAEKVTPLRQFHRVLKAEGRLGITTGSRDHQNALQDIRKRILGRAPYAGFRDVVAGTSHRVGVDELKALLEQTGFAVSSIEVLPNVIIHASAEDAIEFSQASSFGNFLGHLPEELRPKARDEIVRELDALRTSEGVRLESARILAVARKIAH